MLTNVYMKTSSPLGLVRAYFVVQMSVCVSVYMSMQMCRCPYADSVSARECLSHASTYLEFPQQAFTCGFHDRRLLVVFTTVRLLKSPLNTKISKPRQNRCLRVIRFTRKRSNQRKITSKHRSYRLQSPVNRKFEANGEKNFVYWWILLAEIAFTGDSNWRQSRLAATSACRTSANGSTSVSGEKSILLLSRHSP